MKKFLFGLLAMLAIVIPGGVQAKSYSFGGYYCDSKQPVGDGTFYMTCHIVAKTDFDVNHITGTLILKNVTLQSIKTKDDWVSNNGLSSNVDFTADSKHNGEFAVADLVFTGNLSATECETSFMPDKAEETTPSTPTPTPDPEPQKYTCAKVDDEFYGSNGTKVTEERYMEECCQYKCTIVDNKYYFNASGKSVSYDKFLEDCSTSTVVPNDPTLPDNPRTGFNYGYIIVPIGILSIVGIKRFAKKNTKIYKI